GIRDFHVTGVQTCALPILAKMLGYEPNDMLGRPAIDFVPPSLREEALMLLERHHAGIAEHFDTRLAQKNGSELWVSVASSPMFEDRQSVVKGKCGARGGRR